MKNHLLNIFNTKIYTKKIILFAVLLQIVLFFYNLFCGQMHIDEVMLMLNARSLADYGTDMFGERLPIYFDTWIYGGQSPLPTYVSAITIKLFGYHLWLARLLMLMVSIVALFAFAAVVKSVFRENTALYNLVITFYALQPARINNSLWVLDCAYFAPLFIIGLFFLNKAVNNTAKPYRFFSLAMLFFALSCYSYITAVIIVPLFLLIYYLVLLKGKRITLTSAVVSAVIYSVLLFPLIVFGLVQLGLMGDFSLCGISFSAMENYSRQNDLLFMADKATFPHMLLNNVGGILYYVFLPDFPLVLGFYTDRVKSGLGYFTYGHIISVICIVILIIWLVNRALKKRTVKLQSDAKALLTALGVAYLVYGLTVKFNLSCAHRYAIFFAFFNILSGIGAYLFLKSGFHTGKAASKIIVNAVVVLSVVLMLYSSYNFANASATTDTTSVFEQTFSYVEDTAPEHVTVISNDRIFESRCSVYLRYRYYDDIAEFEPAEREMREINASDGKMRNYKIKTDESIIFDNSVAHPGLLLIDRQIYDSNFSGSNDLKIIKDLDTIIIAENTALQ